MTSERRKCAQKSHVDTPLPVWISLPSWWQQLENAKWMQPQIYPKEGPARLYILVYPPHKASLYPKQIRYYSLTPHMARSLTKATGRSAPSTDFALPQCFALEVFWQQTLYHKKFPWPQEVHNSNGGQPMREWKKGGGLKGSKRWIHLLHFYYLF